MQNMDRMNAPKKAVIWREWKNGSSMSQIASKLQKPPATVYSFLQYHGGIEPAGRVRRPDSLSLQEREEISRRLATGCTIRSIASELLRHPSTISREIARNGGASKYRATVADKFAWKRALRPKECLLAVDAKLREIVSRKLSEDWSPEQISGWLKLTYGDNKSMHISHETIYKSLFIQTRGLFHKELRDHLRTKRRFRHSQKLKTPPRGGLMEGISIRDRPAEVDDRAVPGHWEGDLICGSNNSYIATVVERQTRFTVLVKVEGKNTESVVSALSRQMRKLPALLQQSLTWDRGTEMASHAAFTVATRMKVYFCDPSSPWQRGTNENTNGLLRQYFPKGSCLSGFSQSELNKIAAKLNSRPRKTLGFETPSRQLTNVLH